MCDLEFKEIVSWGLDDYLANHPVTFPYKKDLIIGLDTITLIDLFALGLVKWLNIRYKNYPVDPGTLYDIQEHVDLIVKYFNITGYWFNVVKSVNEFGGKIELSLERECYV